MKQKQFEFKTIIGNKFIPIELVIVEECVCALRGIGKERLYKIFRPLHGQYL